MINKEAGKYYIKENDVEIADLKYTEHDDYYDVTSTFTDPDHRGQGIAKDLVDEIVKDARDENMKIKPTCPYVEHAIRDNSYDDIRL